MRKHHRQAGSGKALARRYDAVIVGAGSADCVVARHLVDGADATVLLLHAGGSVMPTIPSASTNALSIMIGECASRLHERCASVSSTNVASLTRPVLA
jgi:choline dehydrogenase-like flavoprotein